MIYIGCHLSVTDGYEAMGKTMVSFGGNTFAFFTRNPRGGKTKELKDGDAGALMELLRAEGFGPLVAHGSYTMNLCSADPQTRANGLDMLRRDLALMEAMLCSPRSMHRNRMFFFRREVLLSFLSRKGSLIIFSFFVCKNNTFISIIQMFS